MRGIKQGEQARKKELTNSLWFKIKLLQPDGGWKQKIEEKER